jgi:hypothetical protein
MCAVKFRICALFPQIVSLLLSDVETFDMQLITDHVSINKYSLCQF